MLEVHRKAHSVTVRMNGTAYALTSACDVADFKADMGWFASLQDLVAKYLSKLQRVAKAITRMAYELADADNYLRGIGAATLYDARRYV